ncbi:hypothetical protein [Halomarina oriensis]|uniref:Uncharacterized protein n=1 Tax=Halomarina oriensis TaxID=671145 RepID=A0A6B0GUF6_9EURY|nr:hypothetical protein [Halomarina oriensis]MWG36223.1 hypothetical protein [Halomarina oriensis]
MTDSDSFTSSTPLADRVEVVGGEYDVRLVFHTEYVLEGVVAGHYDNDAVEVAETLALHGRHSNPADRDPVHSEVERTRDVFEDDVAAERIDWVDGPTAPSESTFWDDTAHFQETDQ